MSVANDIKGDIEAARKMRLRLPWWGVLCAIIGGLPIVWMFDHFGNLTLFLPTFNSIAVLGLVIALKRKLGRHLWFWITMAVIAALHVPLVLFVPWTTKWVPAIAIAAIDSADLIAIVTILSVVGSLVGPNGAERGQPESRRSSEPRGTESREGQIG
jgi:hypothetical protein